MATLEQAMPTVAPAVSQMPTTAASFLSAKALAPGGHPTGRPPPPPGGPSTRHTTPSSLPPMFFGQPPHPTTRLLEPRIPNDDSSRHGLGDPTKDPTYTTSPGTTSTGRSVNQEPKSINAVQRLEEESCGNS